MYPTEHNLGIIPVVPKVRGSSPIAMARRSCITHPNERHILPCDWHVHTSVPHLQAMSLEHEPGVPPFHCHCAALARGSLIHRCRENVHVAPQGRKRSSDRLRVWHEQGYDPLAYLDVAH